MSELFNKPTIPSTITGIDLETKGTKLNAFILALGGVTFDVRKYQLVECSRLELDPEDKEAKELFTEDAETLRWWEEFDKNPWSPSELARKIAWGGTTPHREGITFFAKMLEQLNKRNSIFTARGPEFDMRVLEVTCVRYGIDHNLRFSNFDSDRTAERMLKALGCSPISENELEKYIRCTDANGPLHSAHYDAAKEGYRTMRAYWLVAIAGAYGLDTLKEAVARLDEGTFDPEAYGEICFE